MEADLLSQTQPHVRPLHILLADDGSQYSQEAAALLKELPLADGSSITILGVVSERLKIAMPAREEELIKYSEYLQREGMPIDSAVRVGHPAEELVRYAEEHPVDLIVMGAIGMRATLGVLLGGVTQQVVEYSEHPILVVRMPARGLHKVLLVVDASQDSQHAALTLAHFPLPEDVQINLLHVLAPVPLEIVARTWSMGPEMMMPVQISPAEQNRIYAEEEQVGKEILARSAARLQQAGLTCTSIMKRGDPATEIMGMIKDRSIDLVVLGSRGESAVRGWLLGSTTRKLVHYAPCSVLVIK